MNKETEILKKVQTYLEELNERAKERQTDTEITLYHEGGEFTTSLALVYLKTLCEINNINLK